MVLIYTGKNTDFKKRYQQESVGEERIVNDILAGLIRIWITKRVFSNTGD